MERKRVFEIVLACLLIVSMTFSTTIFVEAQTTRISGIDPVHDVAVTGVRTSKTVVGQGFTAIILVTVENHGDFTETFNVTAYYNQTAIPTPEQWPNITQSETFWSLGDSNRDGYVDAFDANLVSAVYGATPDKPWWNPDADFNKDGYVDARDIATVGVHYGWDIWTYFGIPSQIRNQTLVTLSSGTSTVITFRGNTAGLVKGNYTLSAYAPLPDDVRPNDNLFVDGWVIVAMIGDITGPKRGVPDGKVDMRDIATVAIAWGSKPCLYRYPRWNPNADITGPTLGLPDGKIDIRDISIETKNFGKIDP